MVVNRFTESISVVIHWYVFI